MNKQEAIKKVEQMGEYERFVNESIPKLSILNILNQLDEPQKVTVPQFVADWYEKNKDDFEGSLFRCIDCIPSLYDGGDLNDLEEWIIDCETKPFQTLVNMHQFGYTVEKEPKYTVKIKGKIGENLLVYGWGIKRYFFARTCNNSSKRGEHTRKKLEEDGFGWVFDCPGVEIEKVTE